MRSVKFIGLATTGNNGSQLTNRTATKARYRSGAALFAMACLLGACGGDQQATGTATPGTVAESQLNSVSGEPADGVDRSVEPDGEEAAALPDAVPVSDASGPGQQGWIPAVNSQVEPDANGAYRGSIDSAGQKHVYTFEAIENQHVVVDQLGGCETANGDHLTGRLEGPGDTGTVRFESDADSCFDIDEFVFTGNGTVTFTIDGGDVTTGSYAFRLLDTTTPPPIAVTDGMTVTGNIEVAGFNDHYQVDVTEGDAITFQQLDCALSADDTFAVDLEGAEVDGSISRIGNDCDRVDRIVAEETGTVDIIVRNTGRLTGTYSFAINFVNSAQDERPQIAMGDSANPEATTPTTGTIEELGQRNSYTFDVTQGQRFVVQQAGGCDLSGGDTLIGRVDGAGFDDRVFIRQDCEEVDRFTAEESGTVTFTVYDSSNATTGNVNFRILDIPIPEDITLVSGDVVEPNQPVDGAGSIDSLGGWDSYLIDVADNQTVTITSTGPCSISDSMILRVLGETTDERAFLSDGRDECFSELSFEAEETVTLRISVSDSTYHQATGTYGFKITVG